MTRRKDPAAVSLGRKGGRKTSQAKTASSRRNASQWGARTIAAWQLAMRRAAEMVRDYAEGKRDQMEGLRTLADRIEAEPWPRDGGK